MPKDRFNINKRYLAVTAVMIIGLYVVVPQLGSFDSSWSLLKQADWNWIGLAMLLTVLTYFAAALTYYLLAFKPMHYMRTVMVQMAAMLINRLLPAGIGAISSNYLYLKKAGHGTAQAATIVGINNLLGFVGHGLIVLVTFIFYSGQMENLGLSHERNISSAWLYGIFIASTLIIAGLVIARHKILKLVKDLAKQLVKYANRPWYLTGALVSSMCLTLLNILGLYCCALAIGVQVPFGAVVIIFSFGIGAATATPTPGGLGGFEAGLAAGFVAYDVGGSAALAIALLYRLVSYWFALILGAVAFGFTQKYRYI